MIFHAPHHWDIKTSAGYICHLYRLRPISHTEFIPITLLMKVYPKSWVKMMDEARLSPTLHMLAHMDYPMLVHPDGIVERLRETCTKRIKIVLKNEKMKGTQRPLPN